MNFPILAIETSCDETAAAVVDEDFRIRSHLVYSQVAEHERFGGVVPEIASRRHLEVLPPLVERVLQEAGVVPGAVAVTIGPGLIGSLLVGVSWAKAFAWARSIPLYPVHHIAGHIFSIFLDEPAWRPPFLALVVSGGHTELIEVGERSFCEVGSTIDDAAGEAFDKAARLLGVGYPGGPAIARAAAAAGDERERLAGKIMPGSTDFSFSGLKTALRYRVKRSEILSDRERSVLAASFQDEVVAALVEKTMLALEETGGRRLLVTGGVAANLLLRERMQAAARLRGIDCRFPRREFCTDNAAMIAAAAAYLEPAPMPLDRAPDPGLVLSV